MRRFLAALLAVLSAVFRGLFAWALPSVPPAPEDDDAAATARQQQASGPADGIIPVGHVLVIKHACQAIADGKRPDADRLAKIHPALSGWVKQLTREEAAKVAQETCGTIRRHLSGPGCIGEVPGVGESAVRHIEASSTELGRRLLARQSSPGVRGRERPPRAA